MITERIPSVRSVALGFWIGAGSRDETPSKAGVTHFIEHLLFKGTRSYTAQQIAEIFDTLGGELNAATSREHTVVYVRVADHHLEQALDVMTRHGLRAALRRARRRARGRARGDRHVRGHAARARPRPDERGCLRRPPARAPRDRNGRRHLVGRTARADELSPDDVPGRQRRRRRGGNLRHDDLVARLERAQRKQAKSPARGPRLRSPLVRPPRPSTRFQRKKTEQYHVCLGAPGIARSDRRRFAASLLDALLGGSASSRLFQEIREKRGMAYAVYTFASQYTDTGLIGFYVGTRAREPRRLPRDRERADRRGLRREVPQGRARAREGEPEGADPALDGVDVEPDEPAREVADQDTELLSIDRIAAEIDAVTPDAVAELAGVLLAPEKLSAAGIGPERGAVPRSGAPDQARAAARAAA